MILTCSIAASASTIAASRRGESTSGSPPVRITSQISRMRADIVERGGELRARERAPVPDHLAAEAEAAIDRADMDRLEQHAVGIAVHDALDRAVRIVADRVGHLLGPASSSAAIGHELARDRIARIGGIDELGDVGGQRQRIARGDRFELGAALARDAARPRSDHRGVRSVLRADLMAEVLAGKSWLPRRRAAKCRAADACVGRPNVNPRHRCARTCHPAPGAADMRAGKPSVALRDAPNSVLACAAGKR